MLLKGEVIFDIWHNKKKIVGFGLQSLKAPVETIRQLLFVFYERKSTRLCLVDISPIENSV